MKSEEIQRTGFVFQPEKKKKKKLLCNPSWVDTYTTHLENMTQNY